ncbi:MAG: PKD domain-containing protein [Anaerolineales bacterium]|nr:MAG: PKD domain-containing protein [Anaerolineales bacterium]
MPLPLWHGAADGDFCQQFHGRVKHLWDYGDSITSTASAVTHTHAYTATGVYTVSLTATGPGGSDTLTRTNYITAYEPVVADFGRTSFGHGATDGSEHHHHLRLRPAVPPHLRHVLQWPGLHLRRRGQRADHGGQRGRPEPDLRLRRTGPADRGERHLRPHLQLQLYRQPGGQERADPLLRGPQSSPRREQHLRGLGLGLQSHREHDHQDRGQSGGDF